MENLVDSVRGALLTIIEGSQNAIIKDSHQCGYRIRPVQAPSPLLPTELVGEILRWVEIETEIHIGALN